MILPTAEVGKPWYPLRNCHIVWSLQRVAEILRLNEQYQELDGVISIAAPSPRTEGERANVGEYKAKYRGAAPVIARDDVGGQQCPAANRSYHFPADLPTFAQGNVTTNATALSNPNFSFRIEVSQSRSSRPFDPISAPHVAVRAVARLAEIPGDDPLRIYTYADAELRISVSIYAPEDVTQPLVTQVATGFVWLVRYMGEAKCYMETRGVIWKENEEGEDEELGLLEMRKYTPLEEEGGKGVDVS